MKKLLNLLLIILLSVTLSNCKKKPEPTLLEQMAERTETGEERLVGIVNNEYIFKNNGIAWVDPEYGLYSWYSETTYGQLYIDGFFFRRDENGVKHEENLIIELYNIYSTGEYVIDQRNDGPTGIVNTGQYYKKGNNYHSDSTYVGRLTVIKLDTINKIVAGTFNLNLINDETNKTITITNGWFDIKY